MNSSRINRPHGTTSLLAAVLIFIATGTYAQSHAAGLQTHAEIRAISLAPHLTELVFTAGAGQYLIGTVEWSDYPEAALNLPRIGDAFRFDIERIVALETTHALAWAGGTPRAAVRQLESLGIEVIEVETQTLDDIAQALHDIGQRFNTMGTAEQSIIEFNRQKNALLSSERQPSQLPLFYQVSERPLFTLGGLHVINEVFALCGARNIFHTLKIEASVVGREAVIAARPFAMIAGAADDQHTAMATTDSSWPEQPPLAHWAEFRQMPAVACGHAWTVDPALLVRPTPRILDGARQLCAWLDQIRQSSAADPACSIDYD